MDKTHPDIRFDAMRGIAYPHRLTYRATLAELEAFTAAVDLRIQWETMRMIGLTTAEVTLTRQEH